MRWPTVNARESFEEMEKRLGITEETNDVRPSSLGAHPSASFYSQTLPDFDLSQMRAQFDKAAERY